MKKISVLLFALLATLSLRADVIFQDALNYPNGLIATDGLWQVYSPFPAPVPPAGDAFVENDLLILNQTNADAVDAQFTNDTGSSIIYASFTINVTSLPTQKGGYFEELQDTHGDYVAHIFIATTNTVVPGTYQLGIDNFSSTVSEANFFPLDLATGITYQVVFSYDTNQADPLTGATLAINPATDDDFFNSPAFGFDKTSSATLLAEVVSRIGFSQYAGQGVAEIGDVFVGTSFDDVMTNTPQIPVIGIQPQGTNIYSYNAIQLYVAASGLGQLTYQWRSNNMPMVDDGVTVVGSASNVLNLLAPTNSASYSVIVGNSAGTTNSQVAVVNVNTTSSAPHFTTQPFNTNAYLSSTVDLKAIAGGTGPLTYTWYYQPTNGGGYFQVGSGLNLILNDLSYAQAGTYYCTCVGAVGSANSTTVTVAVKTPLPVTIGSLRALMTTNVATSYNINAPTVYTVQGVVTSFSPIGSYYTEFYIQDATAGIQVYISASATNSIPPAGALVSVTGQVVAYYGDLEIEGVAYGAGAATNGFNVISEGNSLPPAQLANLSLLATNPFGTYGLAVQGSLLTFTNVYFYKNQSGAVYTNNYTYGSNSYSSFYFTEGPYNTNSSAGPINTNSLSIFIPTYGSPNFGGPATNFWNQVIPGQAYQLTGVLDNYSGAELLVGRPQDIVANAPAPFSAGVTSTGGVTTLSWPAVSGSTYSVYSAASLLGPWTQNFGLDYYPSAGSFTVTNAAAAQFYKISTP